MRSSKYKSSLLKTRSAERRFYQPQLPPLPIGLKPDPDPLLLPHGVLKFEPLLLFHGPLKFVLLLSQGAPEPDLLLFHGPLKFEPLLFHGPLKLDLLLFHGPLKFVLRLYPWLPYGA